MVGTVIPRSIDSIVDDVARAVVENGGKPLQYFLVPYGKWLTARGQLERDRAELGLPLLAKEMPVRNFLVAGTPVVFMRPR